eukprot:8785906-Pyramimonas_sp.AAC.1
MRASNFLPPYPYEIEHDASARRTWIILQTPFILEVLVPTPMHGAEFTIIFKMQEGYPAGTTAG